MVMTPSGAWGGDLVHLEGVGPNFSGGAVLSLKSDDVHQSFLTMDDGSADVFLVTQKGAVQQKILAAGTLNTTYEIDLNAAPLVVVTIDGVTAFSAANFSASLTKGVTVLITASASDRAVTFPANWKWLGLKPTQVASGATGMLSIISTSNADTGIVAAYEVLGTGV